MPCPDCGRGFHNTCYSYDCSTCHGKEDQAVKEARTKVTAATGGVGQPIKNPEDVTDPLSTGRKRAALLYPLFEDQPCEWRGKKNVGGGTPIIGCITGLQEHRHHGPVKNTLRNEPGNVHRICTHCHNRWHAVNNPIYDEAKYNTLPHNPEPASQAELEMNHIYWSTKNVKTERPGTPSH